MANDTQIPFSRTGLMLNKVPEVTVYFWLIKVLSTTVGETAADFLSTTLNLGEDKTALLMSGRRRPDLGEAQPRLLGGPRPVRRGDRGGRRRALRP